MKLRNKKTGGLANIDELCVHTDAGFHDYSSLAELNAEWEDYEEPKKYWFINCCGGVNSIYEEDEEEEDTKASKEIGDYFETKEEAELALRKLKAWKRLKDSKIKFCLDFVMNKIVFTYVIGKNTTVDAVDAERQIYEDMKIVFGGEE